MPRRSTAVLNGESTQQSSADEGIPAVATRNTSHHASTHAGQGIGCSPPGLGVRTRDMVLDAVRIAFTKDVAHMLAVLVLLT